jgi:cytochrome c5
MKKTISIAVAVISVLFISSLIINQLNAQNAKSGSNQGKAIPANVMKIIDKSCVACHAEPGNMMAISHLNLSNWDKYSAEKQADKAKDICTQVTKSKMPPKSFTSKHPDAVISSDQLNEICNWAQSIQGTKK